jgi:hypothetical protein
LPPPVISDRCAKYVSPVFIHANGWGVIARPRRGKYLHGDCQLTADIAQTSYSEHFVCIRGVYYCRRCGLDFKKPTHTKPPGGCCLSSHFEPNASFSRNGGVVVKTIERSERTKPLVFNGNPRHPRVRVPRSHVGAQPYMGGRNLLVRGSDSIANSRS